MTDSDADALTWQFLSGAALVVREMAPSNSVACTGNHQNTAGYLRVHEDWTFRSAEIRHDHASQTICTRIRAEAVPITGLTDDPGFEGPRLFPTSVV